MQKLDLSLPDGYFIQWSTVSLFFALIGGITAVMRPLLSSDYFGGWGRFQLVSCPLHEITFYYCCEIPSHAAEDGSCPQWAESILLLCTIRTFDASSCCRGRRRGRRSSYKATESTEPVRRCEIKWRFHVVTPVLWWQVEASDLFALLPHSWWRLMDAKVTFDGCIQSYNKDWYVIGCQEFTSVKSLFI